MPHRKPQHGHTHPIRMEVHRRPNLRIPTQEGLKRAGYEMRKVREGHGIVVQRWYKKIKRGGHHQMLLVNHVGEAGRLTPVACIQYTPNMTAYKVSPRIEGLLMFHASPEWRGKSQRKLEHMTVGPGEVTVIKGLGLGSEIGLNELMQGEHLGISAVSFGTKPKAGPYSKFRTVGVNQRMLTWIPGITELPRGYNPPGHMMHEKSKIPIRKPRP